jgi:hypothetical protein
MKKKNKGNKGNKEGNGGVNGGAAQNADESMD